MILVFDVGNSETTIGLFDGEKLRGHWRIMTGVTRTADEFGVLIVALLAQGRFAQKDVSGVAIGSVVPAVTGPLREACARVLAIPSVVVIDAGSKLGITLEVDEPRTVGADRIINTLAASRRYKRDCIVVDLGTATTFDCITGEGVFLGGAIAPGVATAGETLTRKTSKLPATELTVPEKAIGTRTEDCIRAGVIFGAADAIDGMVRRIKREWPNRSEPTVIATGGFAEMFGDLCEEFDSVEPYLTLQGLQMAHAMLAESGSRGARKPKK